MNKSCNHTWMKHNSSMNKLCNHTCMKPSYET